MIAHLKGLVFDLGIHSFILEVMGVGYEIYASQSLLANLQIGREKNCYIYMAVREDDISLYGFNTLEEKQLFLKLISVSGIGPKLGMNILSQMSLENLITAILKEDLASLTKLSGIGKKSAERMVVELKDKFKEFQFTNSINTETTKQLAVEADLISALVNLGYLSYEVEKKLKNIEWPSEMSFEQKLKESLKILSRKN